MSTTDFKHYTDTEPIHDAARLNLRTVVEMDGVSHKGMVVKIGWNLVAALIKHEQWVQFHNSERAETMADDPVRFADLKPIAAQITLKPGQAKEISDMLIGIFFEDISYAADGGL